MQTVPWHPLDPKYQPIYQGIDLRLSSLNCFAHIHQDYTGLGQRFIVYLVLIMDNG